MHQVECWQLPFCFPKGGVKTQICGLSLACVFQLALCKCSLAICQRLLSLLIRKCTQEFGYRVWIFVCCVCLCCTEDWGCPWARWKDLWVRCPLQLVGWFPDGVHNTVSEIHIPLIPSENPKWCSLSFSHSPVLRFIIQYSLDRLRQKWAPFSVFYTFLSLSLVNRRNHRLRFLLALSCAVLGERWWLCSSSFSNVSKLFFFLLQYCPGKFLETWTSTMALLALSKTVFCRRS